MSERTALYRMYATDGALLYVGVTKAPGARWQQHAESQPWWPEVQRQTVDWLPDRVAALKAEAEAIRTEQPRYNRSPGHLSAGTGKTPVRNFRMDEDLWRAAQEKATDEGRTLSAVIVDYLREYGAPARKRREAAARGATDVGE